MKNYVITTTLPSSFGGRTKALLKRTKLLNEELGTDFILVTTNNNPNYQEIYEAYIKNGYVQPETTFLNIYDDLIPKPFPKKKVKHKVKERGYKHQKVKNRNAYKYMKRGKYSLFKSFEYEDGSLKFIDYIRKNTTRRKYRDFYNKNGYRYRRDTYNEELQVIKEELLDGKGKVYLTKSFIASGQKSRVDQITLYENYRFKKTKVFYSESDFFAHWYEQIFEPYSNIICDARKIDEALMKVNKPLNKIFQIHSSLKSQDATVFSKKFISKNPEQADKIVFLTEKQRSEFLQHTNCSEDQLEVIPHFIEECSIASIHRDKNRLCVVSRLHPDKQIDHVIQVFPSILKKYQDKKLYIYGDGPEQKRLDDLIKQKGLENSVRLMGKTEQPERVFQESAFSVFTSKHEGFGLVVLESLNNGCPVISYDTDYGPSDMIRDSENGFLVNKNDPKDLESKVIAMIESDIDEKAQKAMNVEEKFRKESYIQSWDRILK